MKVVPGNFRKLVISDTQQKQLPLRIGMHFYYSRSYSSWITGTSLLSVILLHVLLKSCSCVHSFIYPGNLSSACTTPTLGFSCPDMRSNVSLAASCLSRGPWLQPPRGGVFPAYLVQLQFSASAPRGLTSVSWCGPPTRGREPFGCSRAICR